MGYDPSIPRMVAEQATIEAGDDLPRAMCCLCFGVFTVPDLSVTVDGDPVDVCKLCAAKELEHLLIKINNLEEEIERLRDKNE